MEVVRSAVVAKSLPQTEYLIFGGLCQVGNGGEGFHKAKKVVEPLVYARLCSMTSESQMW